MLLCFRVPTKNLRIGNFGERFVQNAHGDVGLRSSEHQRRGQPDHIWTGRYGSGGDDSRLMPLFIGYPEFVRGYGVNSFEAGECVSSENCPTFDRLVGSRLMVGNLEFRFPLLRPFGVNDRMYGPVPVEVAFFLDGGVTWSKGDKPSFFNGTRKPVTSGGISLRTNLMGFAVAQIDYTRPFQREGRGWIWGFSLTPGF